jgi:hypothetical protein
MTENKAAACPEKIDCLDTEVSVGIQAKVADSRMTMGSPAFACACERLPTDPKPSHQRQSIAALPLPKSLHFPSQAARHVVEHRRIGRRDIDQAGVVIGQPIGKSVFKASPISLSRV